MAYECNLKQNRIGVITAKNLYDYKLALNEVTKEYEVTSNKDGHRWGAGKTVKGALISALNCGVRLKKIDTSEEDWIPVHEILQAVRS